MSNTTELSVPIAEESSLGVPGPDNQTDDVQIAGGGRKELSFVVYRMPFFVSEPLKPHLQMFWNSLNKNSFREPLQWDIFL